MLPANTRPRASKATAARALPWLALASAALAGCRPPLVPHAPEPVFVLVTSSLRAKVSEADKPEVTPTPRYREMRPSIRKLAVVAPTSCVNEPTSQAAGIGGDGSDRILETECGVEMTEIERVLSLQQYAVISWRTMAQYRDRLPTDVAAQLGAQVLVQINSLERQDDARGRYQATLVHEYFASSPYGDQGAAVSLAEQDVVQLNRIAEPLERGLRVEPLPGVLLDLVVVDVATKENLWFYRWGRVAHEDIGHGSSVLVRGDPQVASYSNVHDELVPNVASYVWQPIVPAPRPAGYPAAAAPQPAIVRTQEHFSNAVGSHDSNRQAQWALLRAIISDFAARFHDGTS